MTGKVAIPRALLYYQYYPMWKAFFEELGAEVITSEETTKSALAAGSARVVAETCLPTKVFCGHVIGIADKVDFVFIPSIRSLEPQVYNCSKFLGLPDLVRVTVKESPPILDIEIDVNKGQKNVREQIHWLGRHFTRNPFRINRAYERALAVEREYQRTMSAQRLTPPEAIVVLASGVVEEGVCDEGGQRRADGQRVTVAVVGHPYNIYDNYINHNMLKRLKSLGARIVTAEIAPEGALDAGTAKLVGKPYWTYEDEVVGAAGYYLDTDVDGIICVVCFGCGPDSLMIDVIQRAAKERGNKPMMVITLDEHTGEAGLVTRMEAFVDMLQRRARVPRLAKRASRA
ncbi:MAG: hypothetical protein HY675_17845 [Chloroflexi bacterium]|nr:hypothetical protein [Chloroflexota bacterium]